MSSPEATTATDASAAQLPKVVEGSDAPTQGAPQDAPQDTTPDSEQQDAPSSDREDGEASEDDEASPKDTKDKGKESGFAPPLPSGPIPDGPPLPSEPVPQQADDGWDCQWDPATQNWFFVNRFTGKSQWDNPRITAAPAAAPGTQPSAPQPPASEKPAAGGYNPAIHGDYDPNAWYAKGEAEEHELAPGIAALGDAADGYGVTASFNRFTGHFQAGDQGPERHSDESKSRRQMNAFFDVDAAANSHDGRSLKAERSGKKPSKTELKAFKEKRRARKEEKRRAWLRD